MSASPTFGIRGTGAGVNRAVAVKAITGGGRPRLTGVTESAVAAVEVRGRPEQLGQVEQQGTFGLRLTLGSSVGDRCRSRSCGAAIPTRGPQFETAAQPVDVCVVFAKRGWLGRP